MTNDFPSFSNEEKKLSVRDMGLSTGATNALLAGNINTLADLAMVILNGRLMKYRNIGQKKHNEIIARFEELQDKSFYANAEKIVRYKIRKDEILKQIEKHKQEIQELEQEQKYCDFVLARTKKILNLTKTK